MVESEPTDTSFVTASQLLRAWGIQVEAEDIPILMVHWPTAYLIMQRDWNKVLSRIAWHMGLTGIRPHRKAQARNFLANPGPLPHWPPPDSSAWEYVGEACSISDPKVPMSAARCRDIAGDIRLWSAHTWSFEPHLVEQERLRMERAVIDLQSWSNMLAFQSMKQEHKFKYESFKLLECVRMCAYLKGGGDCLADVVERSLRIALPGLLAGMDTEDLKCKLPSRRVIGRAELSLDLSLVLLMRLRCASSSFFRWGWSDSSPIAGFDWLWHRYIEVSQSKVVETADALNRLAASTRQFARRQERFLQKAASVDVEVDSPQNAYFTLASSWQPLLEILKVNIFEVVCPPSALGSGHRGLAHKVAETPSNWAFETPETMPLRNVACQYEGHTSDAGTELSIPDFYNTRPEELLPAWMRNRGSCPDVSNDFEDNESDHADIDDLFEADGADESLLIEHDGAGSPHEFFMPRSLSFVGMQHTCHNITKDVHSSMAHWPDHFKQLKQFEALLKVPERRQRYVASCLMGTPAEPLARRFKQFGHSLYEARWREVVAFIKALNELLPILCKTWDYEKYIAYSDSKSEARQSQNEAQDRADKAAHLVEFNPQKLTGTIHSGLFFLFNEMILHVEKVPSRLAQRLEICVCHEPLVVKMKEFKKIQLMQLHYGSGVKSCPAQGMTLAEAVAEGLDSVEQELKQHVIEDLTSLQQLHGTTPLSADDWEILTTNFDHAKAVILSNWKARTDYLRRIPWLFTGLACVDETKARAVGEKAIAQLENDSSAEAHHRKTRRLMKLGSAFLNCLYRFVKDRVPRSELSMEFRYQVAVWRLGSL